MIEDRWIVVPDAPGKQGRLPPPGRRLEALKLAEDFERSTFARELRTGRDVLPLEEPSHQRRGCYRLDLAAKAAERKCVDARKKSTVTPFFF